MFTGVRTQAAFFASRVCVRVRVRIQRRYARLVIKAARVCVSLKSCCCCVCLRSRVLLPALELCPSRNSLRRLESGFYWVIVKLPACLGVMLRDGIIYCPHTRAWCKQFQHNPNERLRGILINERQNPSRLLFPSKPANFEK